MKKYKHNYKYTKTYEMNKQVSPERLAKHCATGDFCPVASYGPCPFKIRHCENVVAEDWESILVKE